MGQGSTPNTLRAIDAEQVAPRRRAPSRSSITDAALVNDALAGDQWSKDALVRRHARELVQRVTRLLGSSRGVEDVCQDTFLAAFERLVQLKEPAAFRGWLLRIAINKVRRVIRRRSLLRRLGLDRPVPDATLEALLCEGVGPEVRAEFAELDRALATLPAEQKIAWMLRYVEGHTVRDVARLCGVSLTTTKRRLAAAHRKVLALVDVEVIGRAW